MKKVISIVSMIAFSAISTLGNNSEFDEIRTLIENGKHSDAIIQLDEVITDREHDLGSLYQMRGQCFYLSKEYEKAEINFRKSLSISEGVMIRFMVGKTLMYQAKYHDAYAMFVSTKEGLSEKTPEHTKFQVDYHITYALFEMKKDARAMELYKELIKKHPTEDVSDVKYYVERYEKQKGETGQSSDISKTSSPRGAEGGSGSESSNP